jgi:hypothetical protein
MLDPDVPGSENLRENLVQLQKYPGVGNPKVGPEGRLGGMSDFGFWQGKRTSVLPKMKGARNERC